MGHGGYGRRKAAATHRRKSVFQRRSKDLNVDKKSKISKPKAVSLKNQIRSIERFLRKDLPPLVKEAQYQKLEQLKKQQEIHNNLALESQVFLRDRKIKFFERRKIERRLRRLEKQQRASAGAQDPGLAEQLAKLKEDLEYVKFFPKTEKYVSLFMGGDEAETVEKRNRLRKQIKDNRIAAAASGKDLEETGSEDDGLLDLSEDDFFLNASSSDEEADDEWSAREQASSASGIAASGMSSDERNKKRNNARAMMPPPGPSRSTKNVTRFAATCGKRSDISTSSNTSNSTGRFFNRRERPSYSTTGNSGNLSSNSDARKPRRKRRPKKKKSLGQ